MGQKIFDTSLLYKFKVKGYQIGNEIIDLDQDLLDIYNLEDKLPNIKDKRILITKKGIVKRAKRILENKFDLHNINYLPEKVVENISTYYDFGLIESKTILERVEKVSSIISPYKLPIKFGMKTELKQRILIDSVFFNTISLEKKTTTETITAYIHELIHTQLESQKGVVQNYHNREIVSIFIEYLSALLIDEKGDLLRKVQNTRWDDFFNSVYFLNQYIDTYEFMNRKIEASIYIVSSLKAENLFNMYLNSNNKDKEMMLQNIQDIFDGKITVEDFLEKYNITFENSKKENIITKHLKL